MKNDAILLTQYEKYGVLKREDFVQCFIDEMDINLSFVVGIMSGLRSREMQALLQTGKSW